MTWTTWCGTCREPATFRCRERLHDVRDLLADRDPAVEQWQESISARLQRVEQERDAALAELTAVQRELGFSRRAEDDLRAQLEQELARRAHLHEALTAAVLDREHARAQLDDAIRHWAAEAKRLRGQGYGGVYVARDDYGLTCLFCDGPIVRGQAVETQPGTANGTWQHACCPAAGGQS
ncbi:hypothetical protein ACFQS1_19895 [Paractinoplanes rhizophilus]|uniref:Recombinase zinc beta ribbon domain-containing protein n=1 Tax=Paractinoplanes rhizophilus TaxID=1416877 RepID=A0ABW2HT40_9ACTN